MKITYIPRSLDEAEQMYAIMKPDMEFEDFLTLLREEKELAGEEEADRELNDYKTWRYYQ